MRRTRGRRRTRGGKKNFIKSAIKRPGALTNNKRPGETTTQAAKRLAKHGTPLQRRQANFFLNVLKPGGSRRRKKKAGGRRRRGYGGYRVRAHTRRVGGRRVRVRGHRRSRGRR